MDPGAKSFAPAFLELPDDPGIGSLDSPMGAGSVLLRVSSLASAKGSLSVCGQIPFMIDIMSCSIYCEHREQLFQQIKDSVPSFDIFPLSESISNGR